MFRKLLEHPLTRGYAVDHPETTIRRRRIIREKEILRKLYQEWYGRLINALPSGAGAVIELGSGGGFLAELLPACITTEVFRCDGADVVLDARSLPLRSDSLRGILMVDVLHHIPDVGLFLEEAQRALRSGGVIAMIEPWVTTWSAIIYNRFHPEPFHVDARTWSFPPSGPLSGANGALPWIVFERDHVIFQKRFPAFSIECIEKDYPLSYLASGGVSMRALSPGWSFSLWRYLDRRLAPVLGAMFAFITVRRR